MYNSVYKQRYIPTRDEYRGGGCVWGGEGDEIFTTLGNREPNARSRRSIMQRLVPDLGPAPYIDTAVRARVGEGAVSCY